MLSNRMFVEVVMKSGLARIARTVPMVSIDSVPTLLVGQLEIAPGLADYLSLAKGRKVTFGCIEGIKVSGRRVEAELA